MYGYTDGFARLVGHEGPEIPAWQRTPIGRLFSVVYAENGWLAHFRQFPAKVC